MTENKRNALKQILIDARSRLLIRLPFFGLMLMHLDFYASSEVTKASTNGIAVYFEPKYLEKLYERELDYLLCHIVLHVAFSDIFRSEDCKSKNFHRASDIVINAHLTKIDGFEMKYPHFGNLPTRTPEPPIDGTELSADEVYNRIPYDVGSLPDSILSRYFIDSDEAWGHFGSLAPRGELLLKSLYRYSAEYRDKGGEYVTEGEPETESGSEGEGNEIASKDKIAENCNEITLNCMNETDSNDYGALHNALKRNLGTLGKGRVDWRKELQKFLSLEVCDYSFTPPDRRLDGFDVFLPDFNERDTSVLNVLFAVDTSDSVSKGQLTSAYSEIRSAIESYSGKVKGSLIFFDTEVIGPYDIMTVRSVTELIPLGGGGTDFEPIFEFATNGDTSSLPACIIVFTDGFAPYPDVSAACGIPVLWILDSDLITPPFGKTIVLSEI